MMPVVQKYGTIPAVGIEEWNIGPYCKETSCSVRNGVAVRKDDIPVKVFVSLQK